MASDPFSSLVLLLLFFIAGAFVRAAEAASRFVDESALEKDSPGARWKALTEDRFGEADAAFGFLLLGACVCASLWLGAPLYRALSAFVRAAFLRALLAGAALWLATGVLFTALAGLLPAYAASRSPVGTLKRAAGPARMLLTLLKPGTALARGLASLLARPLHLRPAALTQRVTEQEIRMMVDIGEEKGEIEADEKQMIENIFEFNNMTAEDCMVHRTDVTGIDVEDSPEEILRTIRESGLSRFPVYEEDIDSVVGILTTRDYLLNACVSGGKPLRELIRPAYFVPETLRADLLFSEMQKRKQHIAIVVDEYGGTSGLVTMEDLLEEIVGNIYDEFDPQAGEDIIPIGENRWRVSGATELDVLGEKLGVDLDTGEECDTLGGLVFSHLTEIPADGGRPVVTCMGLRISVEQILDRRVEWAIVEKLPGPDAAPAQDAASVPEAAPENAPKPGDAPAR